MATDRMFHWFAVNNNFSQIFWKQSNKLEWSFCIIFPYLCGWRTLRLFEDDWNDHCFTRRWTFWDFEFKLCWSFWRIWKSKWCICLTQKGISRMNTTIVPKSFKLVLVDDQSRAIHLFSIWRIYVTFRFSKCISFDSRGIKTTFFENTWNIEMQARLKIWFAVDVSELSKLSKL